MESAESRDLNHTETLTESRGLNHTEILTDFRDLNHTEISTDFRDLNHTETSTYFRDLNHTETGSGDDFQDSSCMYAILVLVVILLSLCVFLCLRFLCRNRIYAPVNSRLRSLLPDRLTGSNGASRRNLPCQVECYGNGTVHLCIERKLNRSIIKKQDVPLVLFVYNVSRELEDLRNALQWIEGDRGRKREEISAVILLQKSTKELNLPAEVDHQGIFDEKSVVVRILWDAPDRIQEIGRNKEAMDKVKQIINECHY